MTFRSFVPGLLPRGRGSHDLGRPDSEHAHIETMLDYNRRGHEALDGESFGAAVTPMPSSRRARSAAVALTGALALSPTTVQPSSPCTPSLLIEVSSAEGERRLSRLSFLSAQVYVNGREWLCRRLDEKGIRYRRYDNALVEIDDVEAAQELCERFAHRNWPRLLNALARRVNPLLAVVEAAGFGGYYWVTDQAELATDVMFRSRAALLEIMPDLYEAAVLLLSSEDVLRFLGRKLHPSFQGEVVTSDKYRRPEGRRVKHRVRRNSIKMYDKYSVLRIETTINNPGDSRCSRVPTRGTGGRRGGFQ